jgi:hypothetical protein
LRQPGGPRQQALEHDPRGQLVVVCGGQPHQRGQREVTGLQVVALVNGAAESFEVVVAGQGGLEVLPAGQRLPGRGGGGEVVPFGVEAVA